MHTTRKVIRSHRDRIQEAARRTETITWVDRTKQILLSGISCRNKFPSENKPCKVHAIYDQRLHQSTEFQVHYFVHERNGYHKASNEMPIVHSPNSVATPKDSLVRVRDDQRHSDVMTDGKATNAGREWMQSKCNCLAYSLKCARITFFPLKLHQIFRMSLLDASNWPVAMSNCRMRES